MEKLIELLNEHRREIVKKQSWITQWHYNGYIFSLDNISWQQAELLIISKQYWFIQWLVENEKIDIVKVKDYSDLYIKYSSNKSEKGAITDIVLMLLSISDTPIEDLISYLH